jgi:hemoglobin
MRRLHWLALIGLGGLWALLAAAGRAQNPPPGAPERKGPDAILYNTLRDVINRGADLYNRGDWAGCYRLYEGALMALQPLLEHRPELQKAISDGLAKAESDAVLYRRAWVLRSVLDKVRSDVNPNPRPAPKPEDKTVEKKPESKPPEPKPPEPTKPAEPRPPQDKKGAKLWDRLGGEKGVAKIVNDLVKAVSTDPKVDFTRGGKYPLTPPDVALLKKHLVEQISSLTGGPYKYEGLDMREVHKGMGITTAQYDAFVADVEKVLRDNDVPPEDAAQIVTAVNSYRKDIIEAAKPPQKPEDKKPEDKGPPVGKPEDKKSDQPPGLSGKVTSAGKPLASGTIGLHGRGKNYSAAIRDDGSYEIKGVRPGEYTVTVQDPGINKKFSDPKTSSLRVNVGEQDKTANFEVSE